MLTLAKEKGLLVGCAPDTFLGAGLQTCRQLIDEGAIGEPVAPTAFFGYPGPEIWHPDPAGHYTRGSGPMFEMGPYYLTALQGIRCNAICPGATKTNISETMPRERLDPAGSQRIGAFLGLIPALLEPGDIAALALFLASDAARYINGAIIPADAGWTAA